MSNGSKQLKKIRRNFRRTIKKIEMEREEFLSVLLQYGEAYVRDLQLEHERLLIEMKKVIRPGVLRRIYRFFFA